MSNPPTPKSKKSPNLAFSHFIKKIYEKKKERPEFEESDDDESVESTGLENLIFRHPKGLGNPRNRGEKAEDSGAAPVLVAAMGYGDGMTVGEAARVVDGGVRGLFLQYGEEEGSDQC